MRYMYNAYRARSHSLGSSNAASQDSSWKEDTYILGLLGAVVAGVSVKADPMPFDNRGGGARPPSEVFQGDGIALIVSSLVKSGKLSRDDALMVES